MTETINNVVSLINNEEAEKTLYFTKRINGICVSYSPETSEEIMHEIIGYASKYISGFIGNDIVKYNPTGYREGTVEHCGVDYIQNHCQIENSFCPEVVDISESDLDKLIFYCVIVKKDNSTVKLYRRLTNFKRLTSRGFIASLRGNKLNKLGGSLLGIDGYVDLIEFNGDIFILSHTALERIFDLKEEFTKKATEALSVLKKSKGILNMDQFEEDCLNDGRIKKTLTRMLNERDMLENCFDNFDNVINAINMFNLEIEVSIVGEPAIVYDDKSQVYDILRLASDSYYRSIVREQLGVDNKV